MKRIAYFNASSGVSGDMFVGALVDAGASLAILREHIACLKLEGIELAVHRVHRKGIAAVKFDVLEPGNNRLVDAPEAAAQQHQHRGLPEICRIIADSSLPGELKADATGIFELLAQAEAKVHGTTIEQVHFHEVGALDCLADIVAGVSAFHQLEIAEAWCSPIHVGSGRLNCAHGLLPIPAPATMELLQGIPAVAGPVAGELATPTGVALLKHFCTDFMTMPLMRIDRTGYGAGSRELAIPNLLRVTLGTEYRIQQAAS